jgi:zinc protease
VPRATKMVLDEIRGIREAPVSADELDMVKRSLVETFPSYFASKAQAMSTFAADELTGRDSAYWSTYRERIQAVTAEEVLRVARTYLDPARMAILVVGDQKEIALGEDAEIKLAALAGGKVTDLPLRDPMTMKPLP